MPNIYTLVKPDKYFKARTSLGDIRTKKLAFKIRIMNFLLFFFQEVVYDIDILSFSFAGRVEHEQLQQLKPSPYQVDPPSLPMTTVITYVVVIMGSSTRIFRQNT